MTRALPDVALRAPLPRASRAVADAIAPRLEEPQRLVMHAVRDAGRVVVTAPAWSGATTAAWLQALASAERGERVAWLWCDAPPPQQVLDATAELAPDAATLMQVLRWCDGAGDDADLVVVDDAEVVLDGGDLPRVRAPRVVWLCQAVGVPDETAEALDARHVDAIPSKRLRVRVLGPFRDTPTPDRERVEAIMAQQVAEAASAVPVVALWDAPPEVVAQAAAVSPSEVRLALHGGRPGAVLPVEGARWGRQHRRIDEVLGWGGRGDVTAVARASAATAALDKRGCVVRLLCRDAHELTSAALAAELVTRGRAEQSRAPGPGPVALAARAALDADMARRIAEGTPDELLALWLVDRFLLNRGNAHAVVAAYRSQSEVCGVPTGERTLVAVFPVARGYGVWVHRAAGRVANEAMARTIADRLGGRAVFGDLGAGAICADRPSERAMREAIGMAGTSMNTVFCPAPPPLSDPLAPGWHVRS